MAREWKALAAAVTAGLIVVGGAFGVSAIVTHGQPVEERPSPPAKSATHSGSAVPAGQLVASGHGLYRSFCANCHGAQAQGQIGPTLHHLGDPDAKIARAIANGFPNRMPGYKKKLNAEQIQSLVTYIQSLE